MGLNHLALSLNSGSYIPKGGGSKAKHFLVPFAPEGLEALLPPCSHSQLGLVTQVSWSKQRYFSLTLIT